MYHFVTASKDATIYLTTTKSKHWYAMRYLEVSKVYYGNLKDVSRSLNSL